jgi:hypothetical protein
MSTTTAKSTEAPVTMWETFEGYTHGYNDAGDRIIEISARVRPDAWNGYDTTNERSWAVFSEDNEILAEGRADGLRAARKAALDALRPKVTTTLTAPGERAVKVNGEYVGLITREAEGWMWTGNRIPYKTFTLAAKALAARKSR